MGSANSHEIRQIVDEAVVALRSGLQQQSIRHHRPGGAVSMDEDDGDSGEGNDYATDGTDDIGVWEAGYDSASDGPLCGEGCYSDSRWIECCYYETAECCVGGETRRVRGLTHEVCGVRRKKEKNRCKECEKKQKCRKCRKKGPSFWSRCCAVKGRNDWGGDVVGVSRCPGEMRLRRHRSVRRLAAVSGGDQTTACGQAPDGAGTLRSGSGRRGRVAAGTRPAADAAVRRDRCVPPRRVGQDGLRGRVSVSRAGRIRRTEEVEEVETVEAGWECG
ncbi:hypothetical protein LZ30DRAFT_598105 [Colletotrichum cereale]|nr:hypothetical protein LZ30DRAFT_598105 [Colletotrichum cereale]